MPYSAMLFLLSALLTVVPAAQAASGSDLPKPAFDATVKGLVSIEADGCPTQRGNGGRHSQGFLIAADEVLTVNHGTAGCDKIMVRLYGGPNATETAEALSAKVLKALRRSDLALLKLDRPAAGATPLRVSDKQPQPNTSIFTVARWLGAEGVTDKEMRVANSSAGGKLSAIVNEEARRQLGSSGSPSLDLAIVNLDGGTIFPGISGAPLVDAAGVVVAIADGGLKDGGAGINWAIPATELRAVRAAGEPPPGKQEGMVASVLFAAEVDPAAGPETEARAQFKCGDFSLVRLGSRTYDDLMAAADDPSGLQSLDAEDAARTGPFDLYVELNTGATVAVPAEGKLIPRGKQCVADVAGGQLQVVLQLYRAPTLEGVEAASVAYENGVLQSPGWMPFPYWTYPTPRMRYDGLITNRKALFRPDMMGSRLDLVVETLAKRQDMLIGYSVALFGITEQLLEANCEGPESTSNACRISQAFDRAAVSVWATTFARTGWQVAGAASPSGAASP